MSYVWMSADYTVEGHKGSRHPVVYIFARDEQGRRCKFKVPWTPYFYAPAKEVLDGGIIYKAVDGKEVRKVVVDLPRDVPVVSKGYTAAYEDKLPFPIRMLIDKHVVSGFDIVDNAMVPAENLGNIKMKKMYLDIEVELVQNERGQYYFPEPEQAPNMILTISYATNERHITSDPFDKEEDEITVLTATNEEEEREMLQRFFEDVIREDPDVITGWNLVGFDCTYIYNRAKKLGLNPNRMSPMNYVESMGKQKFKVLGMNIIDLDACFKKFFQGRTFDSYKLGDICALKEFLGWKEKEFDYETHMNRNNLDKIIPYTREDIKRTVLLDRKLGLIDLFDSVRRIAGCRLEDTMFTSMYADIATLREYNGFYILGTRGKEEKEEYEGAYVHQPKKGIHKKVIALDFSGMYPNIIIRYNISPETWDPNPKDPENCFVVPGVSRGYFRKDKEGIVPKMIKKFMAFRKTIKDEMKKYKWDDPEYQVLDKMQYGVKQMIAAIYGYFGFVGSRLYYPIIAQSITALGRANIISVIELLQSRGFEVLYGDTDSQLVRLDGEVTTEAISREGRDIEKMVNEFLKERALKEGASHFSTVEFETGYKKILFSGKKKRYAGIVCYYKGKEANTLVIKGFEAKRSDSARVSRDAQKSTLELILNEGTSQQIRKHVLGFVEVLPSLPLEESGIPKVIKKLEEEYEGNSRTALAPILYANMHLGRNYGIGDRAYVFYIKKVPPAYPSQVEIQGKAITINRVALDKKNYEEWKPFIDWQVQTQKVLEAKLDPILDAYGLSFDEVMTGQKQSKLEVFF